MDRPSFTAHARLRTVIGSLLLGALALTGAAQAPAARAADTASVPVRLQAEPFKFEYSIDTTEAPELKEWADGLKPIIEKWYPKIVAMLPSEGYTAPQKFTITFKPMDGVAYASGTNIVAASAWFKAHPDDQGAIVHEMVHVAQQYRGRNPSWLVEGVADYIRWFNYEPTEKRPRVNAARAKYTDSYRTTAAFLNYLVANKDPKLAEKFNAAMRQRKYTPELWKEYTGKTVDELWTEYIATLTKA